jgi:biopolymer transport protein ExbB/biopolymer transport protein TolQ
MLIEKFASVAQVGSQVVLWILIALSIFSISLIVERFVWFRRRRLDVHALGRSLNELLAKGDLAGAVAACRKRSPATEADVMADALSLYTAGHDAVAEMVAGGLRERKPKLEAGLLYLGTLGNNAPFVGLFGTVLGIITSFRELGSSAAGAMGNVMSGISEALVSTAIGILVALPAVVAYNIFQKKANDVEENTAALTNYVFAQMKAHPPEQANHAQVAAGQAPLPVEA